MDAAAAVFLFQCIAELLPGTKQPTGKNVKSWCMSSFEQVDGENYKEYKVMDLPNTQKIYKTLKQQDKDKDRTFWSVDNNNMFSLLLCTVNTQ